MAGELSSLKEKPLPEFILCRVASKGKNRKSARVEQSPERSIADTAGAEWVSIGMDKLGKSNGKSLEAVRNRRSTTNCCLHCFIGLAGSRCYWGSELLEMGFGELTVTGKAKNAESPAALLVMVAEKANITSSKF
nr:hypothetical protein Iba_chr02aCG11360 [Ipomoea batatas]